MSVDRRTRVLVAVALVAARPLSAQTIRREVGVQVLGLDAHDDPTGAGILGAFRPSPRARIQLFAGLLDASGTKIGRGELVAHFLLAPAKRTGAAGYVGGGLAVNVTDGSETRIVALAGFEGRAGARQGWFIEGGVGGGWRLAAGWRWRR